MQVIHPSPSIAIVGGGVIGMSSAWRLAQAGFQVCVYERSEAGREASWAAAGMLAPGGEFDQASRVARLSMTSRNLYKAFVEELETAAGLEIDFQETGALELAYSDCEMAALAHRVERQSTLGISAKRVTAERVATFWPRVNREGLAGGYFYPGDALVDPRTLMAALQKACRLAGVIVKEQADVKAVSAASSHVTVEAERFDAVVIAAGAWSGLLSVEGVPALPRTEPIRGHLLGYQQPAQTCSTTVRHNHTYLFQRSNGILIAGASTERVGFDRSLDLKATAELERKAVQLMPHLGETSPNLAWNGFRPGGDDLHLGAWHSGRLYLAYGHYRNGILLAPVTAEELSRQIIANLQTR